LRAGNENRNASRSLASDMPIEDGQLKRRYAHKLGELAIGVSCGETFECVESIRLREDNVQIVYRRET
jgi:hypothetical protein